MSDADDSSGGVATSRTDGETQLAPTIRLTSVTGADAAPEPDPTEDYHEASRLYAGITDPQVVGALRLERSPAMRVTASRSVKRHPQRPFVGLPAPDLGTATLADTVTKRRSSRAFAAFPLALGDLGTLLHTAYGVTGTVDGTPQAFRAAPSGGALYPLELYAVCHRVEGLEFALYHYDPLLHGLELLGPLTKRADADLTPYGEVLADSAAVVAMTAVFWRSRFKYGARAYRFALTEVGHVAQNLLLAATALGLASVPVGGFYDRKVDELLGVDGVYEGSLYLLPVGHAAE